MIIEENEYFLLNLKNLEWDSEILGIKSAFLEIIEKKESNNIDYFSLLLNKILKSAKTQKIKFITAKINSEKINIINSCIKNNGNLVDTEITFQKNKSIANLDKNIKTFDEISIIKTTNFWDDKLYELVETIPKSRFFIDENISHEKAIKLWETSIFNSCTGRSSYSIISLVNKKPAGLINVFEKNNVSDIFLIAVLPEFQGKNIGTLMFNYYEQNLNNEISVQTVETQLINYQAQKFYNKKGYNNLYAKHTIHFWI